MNLIDSNSIHNDITACFNSISPLIRKTPLFKLPRNEFNLDCELYLKLENFQHTGSYKPRGIFNKFLTEQLPTGTKIVAASGGNHGIAVSYAARALGLTAEIFVPEVTSNKKITLLEQYGANVNIVGKVYGDALEASYQYSQENNLLNLHAFDDPMLILGQGTIGLEIDADLQSAPDAVLAASGGGSLLSGLAAWYQNSNTRVYGAEPFTANAVFEALKFGEPVDVSVSGVAADALGARQMGKCNFPIIQKYVENVFLVSDDDIISTQKLLWEKLRLVVEPAAAVALTAILTKKYEYRKDEKIVIVICGANTDLNFYEQ